MLESIQIVPVPEPLPKPTPEHQKKITRGKIFEIVTVVTLIILGTAFLYWRGESQAVGPEPAETVAASLAAMEAGEAQRVGDTVIFDRKIWTLTRPITGFTAHIDLVGSSLEAPLETAIVWLTPEPGAAAPSEHTLQAAVNGAGMTAQTLVYSAGLAFDKAAKTMEFISDSPRPHDKGVAATEDGWKLTYITYRSFDDQAAPEPILCIVLQRLSAGENEALAPMNRALYDALNSGRDIKSALKEAHEAVPTPPPAS